jgi:hypothetical protein
MYYSALPGVARCALRRSRRARLPLSYDARPCMVSHRDSGSAVREIDGLGDCSFPAPSYDYVSPFGTSLQCVLKRFSEIWPSGLARTNTVSLISRLYGYNLKKMTSCWVDV